MKIKTADILCLLAGAAAASAFLVPKLIRVTSERDDAMLALKAVNPAVVVNSPAETVYIEKEIEADKTPEPSPAPVAEAEPPAADPDSPGRGNEGRRRGRSGPDFQNMTEEERAEFQAEMKKRVSEMDQRRREFAQERLAEFVSQTGLDEKQTAYLGDVVEGLNLTAGEIVAEWVNYINETGNFDTDYRIRFLHDLSSALVSAYDDVDAELPEGWRDTSGGNLNLMSLIDPEVLRPISEAQRAAGIHGPPVEMLLGGGFGPRRGRGENRGNGAGEGGVR